MIPTGRLLVAIAIWGLAGLAASFFGSLGVFWLAIGGGLGLISMIDMLALSAQRPTELRRQPDSRFALGVDGDVKLTVVNHGFLPAKMEIFDGLPPDAESDDMPWRGVIAPKTTIHFDYRVRLLKRGNLTFDLAHARRYSPLGLWTRWNRLGQPSSVKVYPNYEPVIRYSLLALDHHEDQMGIIQRNHQGQSREFHQLRDYHEGDVLSQIDWNATAKRLSLISREYREQRDQNIIVMIDSGRRMRAMDGGLPQFDHCLNAVLLMSFIALRQGDNVGILSFGGSIRWQPPVKGQHAMSTLLNHLYDYETTLSPSDFTEAAEQLLVRQKRRALVVILTNLRSEDALDMLPALRSIQRRHLVMLASLREGSIENILSEPIDSFENALIFGATHLYLEDRRRIFEEMRGHGITTVDSLAKDLPLALTNAYMEVKNSGRL